MTAPTRDALAPVEALSPIDGRYRAATASLRGLLSEAGLIRARIAVEALWLLHLADSVPHLAGSDLPSSVRDRAGQLAREPDADAAEAVKVIEARINHDVKAVEYYVRDQLGKAGASEASLELVHFGCTSEDINNLSYAVMLREARAELCKTLDARINELLQFAQRYADTAMLARTHGQPASPTTLGKEFANAVPRVSRPREGGESAEAQGKGNGAVGILKPRGEPFQNEDGPANAPN